MASKKEYGDDILEIQSDSLKKGQKVVLVDDLLATVLYMTHSYKL